SPSDQTSSASCSRESRLPGCTNKRFKALRAGLLFFHFSFGTTFQMPDGSRRKTSRGPRTYIHTRTEAGISCSNCITCILPVRNKPQLRSHSGQYPYQRNSI